MGLRIVCVAAIAFAANIFVPAVAKAENKSAFSICIGMAEQIAERMPQGGKSDLALSKIALAYARHGETVQTERVANLIHDDRSRAIALLGALAYSNVRERDRNAAIALAQGARDSAAKLTNAALRDNLYWQIAYAQALNGSVEQARATSELIESLSAYDQALYQIAAAQVHNGDVPGALTTTEIIRPGRWRDDAYAVVAGAAARNDDLSAARTYAERSQGKKDSALWFMAAERIEVRDYEAGLALAREITNPGLQGLAFRKVAEAAASSGNMDLASAAYREARARAKTGYQLTEIAIGQANANLFEEALATADQLGKLPKRQRSVMNGNDLVSALAAIAQAQGRAGRPEEARRTLIRARQALADDGQIDGSGAMSVVIAATAVGEIQMARIIAHAMPVQVTHEMYAPPSGLAALGRIAVGLAKSGDFDGAFAIVAEIDGVRRQLFVTDDTLRQIAVEQVRQNNLEAALSTVARISDPQMQVLALAEMATTAK
jgi:hypothetical protein